MLEINQLRCFIAVGEELHFGRAAERLHMTQPPLSRQIRLLEHQVGTPLLERTNRVVRFTAAGKAFFPEAARILRLAEEAAATARRVAKGDRGSIAIGFTAAFGYGLLPQLVRRLQGVIIARRYVLMDYDIRAELVEGAVRLTPGIESPTVSPLHDRGWVAVRAMVPRADTNRIMDELWDLGARGILVTDIHACRL